MNTLLDLQRSLIIHMIWADREHLQALASVPEEQAILDTGTSHVSLLGTMAHVLGSEQTWLSRFLGMNPDRVPGVEDFPTVGALREGFEDLWPQLEAFLAALSHEQLKAEVIWTNTRGETFTKPLWQPLTHMTQHAAYHRGQMTTMLRQLGHQPPTTDFIRYLTR